MITYNDETHTYALDGIRLKSVTQILDIAGLSNYSNIPEDILERARLFGTAVHDMTYLYDNNNLDTESLDPALVPYLAAWRAFLQVTGWTTEAIEQLVYSRRYLYAGRYDRKGIYNGKATLLDIKTGVKNKATVKLAGIQLSGYEIAHNELNGAATIKQRLCVWLGGDGKFKMEIYTDKSDQARFLAALTIANVKEEMK
jgi:hypothetical protein